MFGNILYFIIVLLVYATYEPAESADFPPVEAVTVFFLTAALFALMVKAAFARLGKQIRQDGPAGQDQRLESLIARQSVLALVLFGIDIYGLELPRHTAHLAVFKAFPTLEALLFLAVFVTYLVLIWSAAFGCYRLLQPEAASRREYIRSHLSFSIPVLIPWFLISGLTDILLLLPLETPGKILGSAWGQAGYLLALLILVALFGPVLIQRSWGCLPLEPGFARQRIEALCRKAGVGYADILIWPLFGGRMLTAGVMGLIRRFRYILVTPALLRFLTHEEIDAVMAHEIGHVRKKHLVFYLLFFISLMPTVLLSCALIGQALVFLTVYFFSVDPLTDHPGIQLLLQNPTVHAAIFLAVFYIYFRYVFGYFMRNFERQADIHVFELLQSPIPLITSLEKIALISGQAPDKPNWHHFSIRERIDYIRNCILEPAWIQRHHRKVRAAMLLYLACMLLVIGVFHQMEYGAPGKRINAYLTETVITRKLETNPDDPEAYRMLGDLRFILMKQYGEAVAAYEKALLLDPDAAETLNNLAWLYATCEDESFRNPERALSLAIRAAAINPSPHILDTLAESYHRNGMTRQAVETEQAALEKLGKQDDRSHYEEQLNKFRKSN